MQALLRQSSLPTESSRRCLLFLNTTHPLLLPFSSLHAIFTWKRQNRRILWKSDKTPLHPKKNPTNESEVKEHTKGNGRRKNKNEQKESEKEQEDNDETVFSHDFSAVQSALAEFIISTCVALFAYSHFKILIPIFTMMYYFFFSIIHIHIFIILFLSFFFLNQNNTNKYLTVVFYPLSFTFRLWSPLRLFENNLFKIYILRKEISRPFPKKENVITSLYHFYFIVWWFF